MPEINPDQTQEVEEIDVSELIERIEAQEKINHQNAQSIEEFRGAYGALDARLESIEQSLDAIANFLSQDKAG